MGRKYDFGYIIIGSGPAGSSAAIELAKAGKSVALIEARFLGGSNLASRDIPYRTTLDFSHTYAHMLNFPELKNQHIRFNLPVVPVHQYQVISTASKILLQKLKSAGVTIIKGFASFIDPHTITVSERRLSAATFILAVGSHPVNDGIAGLEATTHYLPGTAIRISRLPRVAAVIGGGPSGVEIAEYYAELGVKVLLFEQASRLLPHFDIEAGTTLTKYFTECLGINVLTDCQVLAMSEDKYSQRLYFRYHNTNKTVRIDTIVLATGSLPNLESLHLERAGITFKSTGIKTNKYFETNVRHIYAVGDCASRESSTDRATTEGMTLATNLISKNRVALNPRGLTNTVNTYPEISCIGYTEEYLLAHRMKYQRALVYLKDVPASYIYNFHYGFLKLLTERTGHILGATIVAPNAELIINELSLVMHHNLTILELASAPHSENSFNFLIKTAARNLLKKKKSTTPIIKIAPSPRKSPPNPRPSESSKTPPKS